MNDPASVAPAACRFRVASAADAAAVHGLFAEYLASLGLTPDAELDADLVDFPAAYTAPGDTFLVAIGADGQLRGMGGIRRGELRRVFVRASQRGRGLARALVLRLLQFGISTGQMQFHGVIARSNGSIREVDLACGLLPTGRVPAHPKQRDCEILAVTRPLVLSRPGMLLVGGTPAHWRALLAEFALQFNVLFAWQESEAAAVDVVREQATAGRWTGAIRCDLARPERLPFLADVVQTLAGPCRALLVLPGAETLFPALQQAFAAQLATHRAAQILRVTEPFRPAELRALLPTVITR
ncbi:hypothetical protein LBMAG56_33880 [Verrucomicrobiota bacterium]|nr:hypothetical protein LBMAG56_33880 [Verrucomicrobiota bacterium]